MSLIGQTLLNQYRLDERISNTSLGELYRAWDIRRNKPMGITILPNSLNEDPEKLKELDTRSIALRKLSHPNLVQFQGLLQTPTVAFLVEDWVDGPTLRDVINSGLLSVNEIMLYVHAVCNALDFLHRHNYIYCSLTPEVVHISQGREILLSNVAAIQQSGEKGFLSGTRQQVRYEAPEQVAGKPISPATDVYSLAVIVFEAITGALPKNKNPNQINPTVPDHFARMLMWALRKEQTRLANTTELLSTLSLAAQLKAEEIPLRASAEVAPVTDAVAKNWNYLPSPQPSLIAYDTVPLDERLAAVSVPQTKQKRISSWRILLILMGLFVTIILITQIRPAETPIVIPPNQPTREIPIVPIGIVSTATETPLPKPTDTHGGRILFTCTRGDYNQLCIINADGTGYKRISDQLANDYYASYAPQGGAFVFSSNRNGAFDIYLFLISGNDLFQLTDHIGNVVSPDFSPDGQKIVFANRASTGPTSIWIIDRKGINPRLIYTGPGAIVATAWSPNGDKIAYALQQDSPNEYQIFLMDVDGRNHRRVTTGLQGVGGSIDWAPDGKSILVYAGPIGDKDIFNVNVETGQFTQLTFGGNNAAASYSPDGQYIVFNSLRTNDQADLYIMNSDGHSTRQLTNDPEPDWQPVWEP